MISPVYVDKRRSHSISRLKQYNYEDWLWFDVQFSLSRFTRSRSSSVNPLFPFGTPSAIWKYEYIKTRGKCSRKNSTCESRTNIFYVHARQKTCYSGNLRPRESIIISCPQRERERERERERYVTFSFECQNHVRFPVWSTGNNFHCWWLISLPLA